MFQAPDLVPGTVFQDAYRIVAPLGEGSYGRVYEAQQLSTGQRVAIKVLRVRDETSGQLAQLTARFERELGVCAELAHPNIARLIDSSNAGEDFLYAVFEHISGTSLQEVLVEEEQLEPSEALHLMGQVLDALSCAHSRGIVHRDLTPANIMLTRTGARRNAILVDFGLGGFARDLRAHNEMRITETGQMLGTPCYASPEQLRGEAPEPTSDLYSWGLVVLECLTGDVPIRGASAQEVIYRQLGSSPVPIPDALRAQPLGRVLEAVVAKDPRRRMSDAGAVLAELTALAAQVPSSPNAARGPGRVRRQVTVACCSFSAAGADAEGLTFDEVDERLHAEQAALEASAIEVGAAIGGAVGGRVFLVFGHLSASENDCRRAGQLALDFVARVSALDDEEGAALRFERRAGIHTGLVVVPERVGATSRPELRGSTPAVAGYLADRASDGEVLVSLDSQLLLRRDFASERVGDCEIRELSRPLPYYALHSGPGVADAEGSPTAFVGRDREMRQILELWTGVQAGEGAAALLIGEAGIGKTRLLREIREQVGSDAWLELRCEPESQTTPLHPVVSALRMAPLSKLIERYPVGRAEYETLLRDAIGDVTSGGSSLELSAPRRKEMTLEAMAALVRAICIDHPLVILFENLHWADPTTLELIAMIGQDVASDQSFAAAEQGSALLLGTARPEFVPSSVGSWSLVPLKRLKPDQVSEMVAKTLDRGEPLPDALVQAVVERSDGVPLFVAEIARAIARADAGGDASQSSADLQAVPSTVRDLLTARLDRVSPGARETAQLAAALGRDFSAELLSHVSSREAGRVRADLDELVEAGLVQPRRGVDGTRYLFRHALLRDAAYDALTRRARTAAHQRAADSLSNHFPEIAADRPEILAIHFDGAGASHDAADQWIRASAQSYRRAAFEEALKQTDRGLTTTRSNAADSALVRRELDLLVLRGTVYLSTRGWAVPETESTFRRALDLSDELGVEPPLMVIYGIWGVYITRSDPTGVESLLPRVRAWSERTSEPILAHQGWSCLGIAAYWRGEVPEAQKCFVEAMKHYREEDQFEGYDGGLYTFAFQFSALSSLGFFDQATALRDEGLALAERRRDPYSVALILAFSTMLEVERGDLESAKSQGERLMKLAEEQLLYGWWGPGAIAVGVALAAAGQADQGLALIRDGIDRYRAVGAMCSVNSYQAYLAQAALGAGRLDDVAGAVEEGTELCGRLWASIHLPEIMRYRGELLAMKGDLVAAEGVLRDALALGTKRGAPTFALRAGSALARVLTETSRSAEAVQILAPLYEGFTEGFDTKPLRDAARLLEELRSAPSERG